MPPNSPSSLNWRVKLTLRESRKGKNYTRYFAALLCQGLK